MRGRFHLRTQGWRRWRLGLALVLAAVAVPRSHQFAPTNTRRQRCALGLRSRFRGAGVRRHLPMRLLPGRWRLARERRGRDLDVWQPREPTVGAERVVRRIERLQVVCQWWRRPGLARLGTLRAGRVEGDWKGRLRLQVELPDAGGPARPRQHLGVMVGRQAEWRKIRPHLKRGIPRQSLRNRPVRPLAQQQRHEAATAAPHPRALPAPVRQARGDQEGTARGREGRALSCCGHERGVSRAPAGARARIGCVSQPARQLHNHDGSSRKGPTA